MHYISYLTQDRRGIKEGENLRSDSEGWTEATSTTNGLSPVGGSLRSLETKVVISNEVLCRCKSAMPQKVLPGMIRKDLQIFKF